MAVAHVQTAQTVSNTFQISETTASMSVTEGSLLLIATATWNSAPGIAVASVQLDGTTGFSFDKGASHAGGGRVELWSFANCPGGSHTVTVTWASALTYKAVFLMEVSGTATSSVQDGAGASATGDSGNPTTGAYNATGTSFWVSATETGSVSLVAGSGWTIPTNGDVLTLGGIEYQANPGVGTLTGDFTTDGSGWTIVGMAYLVAGAGGGSGPVRKRSRATLGVG